MVRGKKQCVEHFIQVACRPVCAPPSLSQQQGWRPKVGVEINLRQPASPPPQGAGARYLLLAMALVLLALAIAMVLLVVLLLVLVLLLLLLQPVRRSHAPNHDRCLPIHSWERNATSNAAAPSAAATDQACFDGVA